MGEISAALVKSLRERSGAGMMDCKRALTETAGDLEGAVDWLRTHGLAAAAKKSGRATADGLIGLCVEGNRGAVVEINSETDFVARNAVFQEFVRAVARLALDNGSDVEALSKVPYPKTGQTVGERLTQLIATVGENMALRRAATLDVQNGLIGAYVHAAQGEGLGRIGVLVAVASSAGGPQVAQLAKHLAMHVAASNPVAVSREGVPADVIEREKRVIAEQAQATGKTGPVLEKIVGGRLNKFFQEVCLLEQPFVLDAEQKVGAVVDQVAKETGGPLTVTGFVRIALGETAKAAAEAQA
ncbi:MAG: translation elongation factor Ts [Defluviicoccus sp.]